MSHDVVKTAIRIPLHALEGEGWDDAYRYLVPILGEPPDTDEFEGIVEWFSYLEKGLDVVRSRARWWLDILLAPVSEPHEHPGLRISLKEVHEKAMPYLKLFKVDSHEVQVVAYTWYNGVDESVEG